MQCKPYKEATGRQVGKTGSCLEMLGARWIKFKKIIPYASFKYKIEFQAFFLKTEQLALPPCHSNRDRRIGTGLALSANYLLSGPHSNSIFSLTADHSNRAAPAIPCLHLRQASSARASCCFLRCKSFRSLNINKRSKNSLKVHLIHQDA